MQKNLFAENNNHKPPAPAVNVQRLVRLKTAMDIEKANCSTCSSLSMDGDGPEYNGTWPVCSKIDRMGHLKSFPFKKDMKCWSPEFWHSKFAIMIKNGSEDEIKQANDSFCAAYDGAIN